MIAIESTHQISLNQLHGLLELGLGVTHPEEVDEEDYCSRCHRHEGECDCVLSWADWQQQKKKWGWE